MQNPSPICPFFLLDAVRKLGSFPNLQQMILDIRDLLHELFSLPLDLTVELLLSCRLPEH